jgi:UDP-N-acetylmuramoylalanine--D-glutamate ligase
MKIAIVGWGVEGKSAFNYFGPEHEYLIVNEEPAADFPQQSDNIKLQFLSGKREPGLTGNVADLSYLDGIKSCDKIIFSVTSRPNLEKRFGKDKTFWDKALTVQHIFFEKVKSRNVIGITGSKGKGTTSTLVAKMLEAGGKKVFLGGNIGISVLDFVNDVKTDDWVVLELSNFQLKDFPYSPHIAICLMLVEEHMDWHPDMEDYVEAKSNIFRHQTKSDIAIYFAEDDNSKKIAGYSPGLKIPYYQKPGARLKDEKIVIGEDDKKIIDESEVKLLGGHNLQNICAAVTATWQVAQDIDAIKQVLSSFSGLEHRLEFVRELKGVKYYNDSFGTAPATAIVAMKAFEQPKIMILGGSDKGASFEELAEEVTKNNVKHAILIGNTAEKISQALRDKGFNSIGYGLTTMPEVVAEAHKLAVPGDVVLLSTATASFGLFKDYKDRGNQFKAAVRALA